MCVVDDGEEEWKRERVLSLRILFLKSRSFQVQQLRHCSFWLCIPKSVTHLFQAQPLVTLLSSISSILFISSILILQLPDFEDATDRIRVIHCATAPSRTSCRRSVPGRRGSPLWRPAEHALCPARA